MVSSVLPRIMAAVLIDFGVTALYVSLQIIVLPWHTYMASVSDEQCNLPVLSVSLSHVHLSLQTKEF